LSQIMLRMIRPESMMTFGPAACLLDSGRSDQSPRRSTSEFSTDRLLSAQSAWGRIVSLIESCRINGNEPFAYLKAALKALANCHLPALLPWAFRPSS